MIWQDPQEMAWIEGQAFVFVCVTLILLALCLVKGLIGVWARRAEEELVHRGMEWLFSSVEESHRRYRIPRDLKRASSSYP